MSPFRIVVELDVLEDVLARLLLIFVAPSLGQLRLERLEERDSDSAPDWLTH